MKDHWDALYEMTDKYTDGWLSSGIMSPPYIVACICLLIISTDLELCGSFSILHRVNGSNKKVLDRHVHVVE